jgi:PAS domain S-box-containing protein
MECEFKVTKKFHLAPQFPLSVLIVEDNRDDAALCLRVLTKAHFEIAHRIVQTAADFIEQLRTEKYDVIVSDYNLGSWTGLDALSLLQESGCDIPFILVTGALGEDKAVECFKFGITDYVLKHNLERLPQAIFRALEETALRNEKRQTERLLKVSEAKFRALADAIPTAVFIEQGTQCRYANRAAVEITGYSQTELLEKNFWELILPSSRKALLRTSPSPSDDLESRSRYQARILTKAGDVRLLDVTVGTFRLDGMLAALISALDITSQKYSCRETPERMDPEATRGRSPRFPATPTPCAGDPQRPV